MRYAPSSLHLGKLLANPQEFYRSLLPDSMACDDAKNLSNTQKELSAAHIIDARLAHSTLFQSVNPHVHVGR